MLDQLTTRHVSVNVGQGSVTADRSFYRPFNIHVGQGAALALYGLIVQSFVAITDANDNHTWALLQKSQTLADNVDDPSGSIFFRGGDRDIIVRGQNSFIVSTGILQRHFVQPHQIWFPKPIWVPRSPTMEFMASTGNVDLKFMATLFYQKQAVSEKDVKQLLKQWIGRKQDVVSSAPRVIDE